MGLCLAQQATDLDTTAVSYDTLRRGSLLAKCIEDELSTVLAECKFF